jgi:hypothetical protein
MKTNAIPVLFGSARNSWENASRPPAPTATIAKESFSSVALLFRMSIWAKNRLRSASQGRSGSSGRPAKRTNGSSYPAAGRNAIAYRARHVCKMHNTTLSGKIPYNTDHKVKLGLPVLARASRPVTPRDSNSMMIHPGNRFGKSEVR